jgi:hypothetical protein
LIFEEVQLVEKKLKHLEFLQQTISRMASNSFLLKGWTVTLVVGLFAFANLKEMNVKYMLLALIPGTFFWILDGYFLQQERKYRDLYNMVSIKPENDIDFALDVTQIRRLLLGAIFSPVLILFYVPILVVIYLAMRYLPGL